MCDEKAAPLTISQRASPGERIIEAAGDLSLTTVPRLRTVLMAMIAHEPTARIVLDLREMDYIDSAGMGLLVEVTRTLKSQGRTLQVIVAPHSQAERAVELMHLSTIMNVTHTLEEEDSPIRSEKV